MNPSISTTIEIVRQARLIQCMIDWPRPLLGRQVGTGVWRDRSWIFVLFHEAYLGIMLTIYVRLEVIKMNASGYFW